MLKKILPVLIIFFVLPVQAQTMLTGKIDYTVDSAREELLKNPVKKLNPELVKANLNDKNYLENKTYSLKGKAELKDRTLAFFSDSTYAVMYNNDKYHVWYYSNYGKLIFAEEKDKLVYPYKSYKYTPSGRLVNMGLRVSKDETFIYNSSGKLIAHWLKDKAYDEKGSVIMTRKYVR